MKKILAIILIIIGILLCLFPTIMNKITKNQMLQKIEEFSEQTKDSEDNTNNAILSMLYEKFQEYNKDLYENGQELVDAFSYENPDFDLTEYGFSENIVGYIDIPKMNITLPIYLGATSDNLKNGAALLSKTSIPIGGENTNSVIAAHRGLIRNAMFRNIQKLEIGDTITVTNMWEELTYKVCEIKIILPTDIDEILIQDGRELITLITCHPYRVNTHRYVVYAEKI